MFSDHRQSLIPDYIKRRKRILPRLGQIPQSCKTLQAINGLEFEVLLCVCLYVGERVKEIAHAQNFETGQHCGSQLEARDTLLAPGPSWKLLARKHSLEMNPSGFLLPEGCAILTYTLEGLGRGIRLPSEGLWGLESCSSPLRKINQHINSQQMLPPWFDAVCKALSSWFVRPTLFRILSSLTSWLAGEQSRGPLAMFHVRSWLGGKQAACSQCQQFRRTWHSSVPINFCLSHTVMQVTPERK